MRQQCLLTSTFSVSSCTLLKHLPGNWNAAIITIIVIITINSRGVKCVLLHFHAI